MTEHRHSKAAEPKPLEHKIPDGSLDINEVKPGYGPNEGSPDPSNPNKLANPFNPVSYVTKPVNASNPANMPAMQSEKPASEVAIHLEQKAKEGNSTPATPASEPKSK